MRTPWAVQHIYAFICFSSEQSDIEDQARPVTKLWVARLNISDKVAQKLIHKHSITVQDVHDALVCVPFIAVLFAADYDDDTYSLGTCHRCNK